MRYKKSIPAGSVVKKDDVLLTYNEKVIKPKKPSDLGIFGIVRTSGYSNKITTTEKRSITAPCDGIVFFVDDYKKGEASDKEDKYIAVFVVSFFDEYDCFCKWYANRNK